MTQSITFKDWEAEQMRDPEFRAAVEELETGYQKERRQVNQTEQAARIIGAEARNEMNAKVIYGLQQEVMEQAKRIEELEAALLDTTRCLIDGEVDIDVGADTAGTMFHKHRILGSGSVQAMVEIYRRLKE